MPRMIRQSKQKFKILGFSPPIWLSPVYSFDLILLSWLSVGLVAELGALLGMYRTFLWILLVLPFGCLGWWVTQCLLRLWLVPRSSQLLGFGLALTWLLHFLNVFTPEVGFDAVWYHLPVIEHVVKTRGLVYIPELYQSLNPLLSDLVFGLGFLVGNELGAKVVAFGFGLTLAALVFKLTRIKADLNWALLVTWLVSTFQVVAWQSSSFYVDIAKAVWELGAVWWLWRWSVTRQDRWLFGAAALVGASLATKFFSLLLWPFFVGVVVWLSFPRWKEWLLFVGTSLLIPLPFWLFSWVQTGHLWFPLTLILSDFGALGGSGDSPFLQIWVRLLQLPQIVNQLLFSRDHTSFVLLLLLPLWPQGLKKIKLIHAWIWLGFIFTQLIIWWWLPPLSTRYSLSGFVVWAVMTGWVVNDVVNRDQTYKNALTLTFLIAIGFNLLPRIAVLPRTGKYVLGSQSKTEYLEQFYDGSINEKLRSWHQGR